MSPILTSLIALSLSAAALATPVSTFPNSPSTIRSSLKPAPLLEDYHVHGTLNDSYIIMLKDDLPPSLKANHFNLLQLAHSENPLMGEGFAGLRHVYDHINGYAGKFSSSVIERLRELPEVEYIERDQIVKTTEYQVHEVSTMSDIDTQKGAPWVSHPVVCYLLCDLPLLS